MRVAVSTPFIWPVEGPVTSRIGPDHPSGIDIGLSTDRNREIKASAAGTVTFSGGSNGEDYGFHIIIDHGGGVETLYAHLSQRIVQAGAVVQQGQLIGIGGSSGKSDGIHLHFEITKDSRVFNPLDLLPDERTPPEATDIDCRNDALVIDAGSRITFDLAGALAAGESVVGLRSRTRHGAPADAAVLDAAAKGTASLDLWSQIEFEGPVRDDAYTLSITTSMAGAAPETIQCAITLHTPRNYATFYVRPAPIQDGDSCTRERGERRRCRRQRAHGRAVRAAHEYAPAHLPHAPRDRSAAHCDADKEARDRNAPARGDAHQDALSLRTPLRLWSLRGADATKQSLACHRCRRGKRRFARSAL